MIWASLALSNPITKATTILLLIHLRAAIAIHYLRELFASWMFSKGIPQPHKMSVSVRVQSSGNFVLLVNGSALEYGQWSQLDARML
jgi:hypothetical protein